MANAEQIVLTSEALRRVLIAAVYRSMATPLSRFDDPCYDEDRAALEAGASLIRRSLEDVDRIAATQIDEEVGELHTDLELIGYGVRDRVLEIEDSIFNRAPEERDQWFADHAAGKAFMVLHGVELSI